MKIRTYKRLVDGVFQVTVHTEDWSEHDRLLMVRFGEPEINLGGTFYYGGDSSSSHEEEEASMSIPASYARVLSETPFTYKFDARDAGSIVAAREIANSWSLAIEARIVSAVGELRSKNDVFTTETITEC